MLSSTKMHRIMIRRKKSSSQITQFHKKRVTKRIIDEDLNTLLDYKKFASIKKHLKEGLIFLIDKEIEKR
jgi:hypothetical protein